ncbi:MAG: glycosyltransferase family 39 protein [Clostridiales bacterium]|jgi:hypothetical protein|nr:glycosyltransferase family 39 protein [Eubacteriales bacterium]MDH7566573.1 glycosyltransferase family 39 protein [Clostridiales bacterium]
MLNIRDYFKGAGKRANRTEAHPDSKSLQRFYVAAAIGIFASALVLDLHNSNTGYFTVKGLQLAFTVLFIASSTFLLYTYLAGKWETATATLVFMVLGSALRICYMLFTGPGTRTHDVYREEWGHMDYIDYIARHFSLPPVNTCQAYHPPVHHILCAVALVGARAAVAGEFLQIKLVQAVMALLNILTLVCFHKILKQAKCGDGAILAGVALFAFHPSNIFFSSKLNNDNTMLFFYVIGFYYLVKWLNTGALRDMVLFALFASLAVLTKLSAVMLLVPAFAAFCLKLAESKESRMEYIKQFSICSLIFLPLASSYTIRNFLLFGQKPGYVPSFGKGFTPTLYNLLYLPIGNVIKNPFNSGGLKGGEFFLEFLFKSSLFGEWSYPGLEGPAYALIIAAAANLAVFLVSMFFIQKEEIKGYGLVFLLNLAVPVALAVKFRTDYPIACSQDFRYIAPALISVGYFLGKAAERSLRRDRLWLKYVVNGSLAAFCILSAAFVLALGNYK